jgi:hypothetical protein
MRRKGDVMADCIVPGCGPDGRNNLGVRLRRPDTTAIGAPNTEALVCDRHVVSGVRITIFYESTNTDEVEVRVHGTTEDASRTTPIRHAPRRDTRDLTADLRPSRGTAATST